MATRSTIGIQNDDKTIDYIYCHWDGYPANNGVLLLNNYNTEDKIRELIALGSISSLGNRIEPSENEKHSFNNPIKNITVSYHRDRGEKLLINHAKNELDINDEEYNYLWKNGECFVDGEKLEKIL
jgi:hypothetical protein